MAYKVQKSRPNAIILLFFQILGSIPLISLFQFSCTKIENVLKLHKKPTKLILTII